MFSGHNDAGPFVTLFIQYWSAVQHIGATLDYKIIAKVNYMSKQVAIDQEECLGCEACVELCPEIFGFDIDETKAYVLMAEDGDEDCIEEAMASCPAACISYE